MNNTPELAVEDPRCPDCLHEDDHAEGCPSAPWKCSKCGTSGQFEENNFESFGGTTEGYIKCTACGHTESWADLSAII